jgi:hypothetical protein
MKTGDEIRSQDENSALFSDPKLVVRGISPPSFGFALSGPSLLLIFFIKSKPCENKDPD